MKIGFSGLKGVVVNGTPSDNPATIEIIIPPDITKENWIKQLLVFNGMLKIRNKIYSDVLPAVLGADHPVKIDLAVGDENNLVLNIAAEEDQDLTESLYGELEEWNGIVSVEKQDDLTLQVSVESGQHINLLTKLSDTVKQQEVLRYLTIYLNVGDEAISITSRDPLVMESTNLFDGDSQDKLDEIVSVAQHDDDSITFSKDVTLDDMIKQIKAKLNAKDIWNELLSENTREGICTKLKSYLEFKLEYIDTLKDRLKTEGDSKRREVLENRIQQQVIEYKKLHHIELLLETPGKSIDIVIIKSIEIQSTPEEQAAHLKVKMLPAEVVSVASSNKSFAISYFNKMNSFIDYINRADKLTQNDISKLLAEFRAQYALFQDASFLELGKETVQAFQQQLLKKLLDLNLPEGDIRHVIRNQLLTLIGNNTVDIIWKVQYEKSDTMSTEQLDTYNKYLDCLLCLVEAQTKMPITFGNVELFDAAENALSELEKCLYIPNAENKPGKDLLKERFDAVNNALAGLGIILQGVNINQLAFESAKGVVQEIIDKVNGKTQISNEINLRVDSISGKIERIEEQIDKLIHNAPKPDQLVYLINAKDYLTKQKKFLENFKRVIDGIESKDKKSANVQSEVKNAIAQFKDWGEFVIQSEIRRSGGSQSSERKLVRKIYNKLMPQAVVDPGFTEQFAVMPKTDQGKFNIGIIFAYLDLRIMSAQASEDDNKGQLSELAEKRSRKLEQVIKGLKQDDPRRSILLIIMTDPIIANIYFNLTSANFKDMTHYNAVLLFTTILIRVLSLEQKNITDPEDRAKLYQLRKMLDDLTMFVDDNAISNIAKQSGILGELENKYGYMDLTLAAEVKIEENLFFSTTDQYDVRYNKAIKLVEKVFLLSSEDPTYYRQWACKYEEENYKKAINEKVDESEAGRLYKFIEILCSETYPALENYNRLKDVDSKLSSEYLRLRFFVNELSQVDRLNSKQAAIQAALAFLHEKMRLIASDTNINSDAKKLAYQEAITHCFNRINSVIKNEIANFWVASYSQAEITSRNTAVAKIQAKSFETVSASLRSRMDHYSEACKKTSGQPASSTCAMASMRTMISKRNVFSQTFGTEKAASGTPPRQGGHETVDQLGRNILYDYYFIQNHEPYDYRPLKQEIVNQFDLLNKISDSSARAQLNLNIHFILSGDQPPIGRYFKELLQIGHQSLLDSYMDCIFSAAKLEPEAMGNAISELHSNISSILGGNSQNKISQMMQLIENTKKTIENSESQAKNAATDKAGHSLKLQQ